MTMTMSIADALLYSVLGISVVFLALVFLILIICVMNIFRKGETKAVPAAAAPMAAAPAAEPVYAPGTAGELKLYDTDERDAAMLMAIIADELGAPLNELRFKSIRELK